MLILNILGPNPAPIEDVLRKDARSPTKYPRMVLARSERPTPQAAQEKR